MWRVAFHEMIAWRMAAATPALYFSFGTGHKGGAWEVSMSRIYDDRPCLLGEGPLWHPERRQLYWFDIPGQRLLTRGEGGASDWALPEMFSAAGWVDRDRLLVASESALWVMDLESGARDRIVGLEGDNPLTRSNDGRADPWGGFWIGTMGRGAEPGLGAIWRYYRGELRQLYPGITITNAICFSPDRRFACFADSAEKKVWKVTLDPLHGWPSGAPEVFVDLTRAGREPDGAVFDADGILWLAEWGSSRVAAYGPDGRFLRALAVDAPQPSCPAFGGADFARMFVTSARIDLSAGALQAAPASGCVFEVDPGAKGLPEYRVIV